MRKPSTSRATRVERRKAVREFEKPIPLPGKGNRMKIPPHIIQLGETLGEQQWAQSPSNSTPTGSSPNRN